MKLELTTLWRLQLNQKPLKTMKMHYEICRSEIFESALHSLVGLYNYNVIGLFNVNDSMTFILGVRALRERESGVNTEVTPESAAVPQRHSGRHSVQPQRGARFMGWRLGQQENHILPQWRGKKDFGSLPFVHRSWSGSQGAHHVEAEVLCETSRTEAEVLGEAWLQTAGAMQLP